MLSGSSEQSIQLSVTYGNKENKKQCGREKVFYQKKQHRFIKEKEL